MADALLGEWKLVSSENFDELLKELGVGMVTRKLAGSAKPSLRFQKKGDEWTFTTTTSLKSQVIKFKVGEPFAEETLDGRKVNTIVTVDGDKLVQTQKDKHDKLVCVIVREVTPSGELKSVRIILTITNPNIVLKLFNTISLFFRLPLLEASFQLASINVNK